MFRSNPFSKERARVEYRQLLAEDPEGVHLNALNQPSSRNWWKLASLLQSGAILLCVLYYISSPKRVCFSENAKYFPRKALYTPLEDVLEYEIRTYHDAFHPEDGFTEYQGASDAVDEAWSKLYNSGIARIPRDQATQLPNKTMPIPGDEEHYIVSFYVYHDLHCLNMIRKAVYPNHYKHEMSDPLEELHVNHCIESLRQSLMCNADVSPMTWTWVERKQESISQLGVAHQCKKWESIAKWVEEHQLLGEFDSKIHLESDFEVPIYHAHDLT